MSATDRQGSRSHKAQRAGGGYGGGMMMARRLSKPKNRKKKGSPRPPPQARDERSGEDLFASFGAPSAAPTGPAVPRSEPAMLFDVLGTAESEQAAAADDDDWADITAAFESTSGTKKEKKAQNAPKSNKEAFSRLMSLQKTNGSWESSINVVEIAKFLFKTSGTKLNSKASQTIAEAAVKKSGAELKQGSLVVVSTTLLALAVLEAHFQAKKATFMLLSTKAAKFLLRHTTGLKDTKSAKLLVAGFLSALQVHLS